ncbi:MAG: NH(3)-dependent synthetase [Phycisphaerales bacterium]|nr:NH(3)-dependent synthetase [Phycisphaerales bacterium]
MPTAQPTVKQLITGLDHNWAPVWQQPVSPATGCRRASGRSAPPLAVSSAPTRSALWRINPTVSDETANAAKHADFVARAKAAGAELAALPELSLLGYPPKDLLSKRSFVDEN